MVVHHLYHGSQDKRTNIAFLRRRIKVDKRSSGSTTLWIIFWISTVLILAYILLGQEVRKCQEESKVLPDILIMECIQILSIGDDSDLEKEGKNGLLPLPVQQRSEHWLYMTMEAPLIPGKLPSFKRKWTHNFDQAARIKRANQRKRLMYQIRHWEMEVAQRPSRN